MDPDASPADSPEGGPSDLLTLPRWPLPCLACASTRDRPPRKSPQHARTIEPGRKPSGLWRFYADGVARPDKKTY